MKNNLPAKLLHIYIFGKMELSGFNKLISTINYKTCEETRKSRATWYHLTTDVFVKFLYKVTSLTYSALLLDFLA